MIKPDMISNVEGFEWDEGNKEKNWIKHGVHWKECEEIFTDEPIYFPDEKHSIDEERFRVHGTTVKGKLLAMIFTIRSRRIRIISARHQNKKEQSRYQNYFKSLTKDYEKTKKN